MFNKKAQKIDRRNKFFNALTCSGNKILDTDVRFCFIDDGVLTGGNSPDVKDYHFVIDYLENQEVPKNDWYTNPVTMIRYLVKEYSVKDTVNKACFLRKNWENLFWNKIENPYTR
jgi:hypothetical protein